MSLFMTNFADRLEGVLAGFDRMVFQGRLRRFCYPKGVDVYLGLRGVPLWDFVDHAQQLTHQLTTAISAAAEKVGIPNYYLESTATVKEDVAREVAAERRLNEGPICLLRCVEPVMTYAIRRDEQTNFLKLVRELRKCNHYYWHEFHPECGFMHTRLGSWFPFDLQVCLNGREWLARQIDRQRIGYRRAARMTRQFRMLRAHSVIRKIPHTHRYQLTPRRKEDRERHPQRGRHSRERIR